MNKINRKTKIAPPIKTYNKYMRHQVDEQDYSCYCGQTKFSKDGKLPPTDYYVKRHLFAHLRIHKPYFWHKYQQGEYKCNVCDKGFQTKAELKLHYYNPETRKFQSHKMQILIDHMVDIQCFFQKETEHHQRMLRIIYQFYEFRYGSYITAKAQGLLELSKDNSDKELDKLRIKKWKKDCLHFTFTSSKPEVIQKEPEQVVIEID